MRFHLGPILAAVGFGLAGIVAGTLIYHYKISIKVWFIMIKRDYTTVATYFATGGTAALRNLDILISPSAQLDIINYRSSQ
jgi:aspartate oxidase